MKVNFGADKEAAREFLKKFEERIAVHDTHAWKKVGRCVYCYDCKERLYEGSIPKSQTNIVTRQTGVEPRSTTEMRARWGKA